MNHEEIAAVFAKPISQEQLGSSIPARPAYVGVDGEPRVALTIDTQDQWPPRALLGASVGDGWLAVGDAEG